MTNTKPIILSTIFVVFNMLLLSTTTVLLAANTQEVESELQRAEKLIGKKSYEDAVISLSKVKGFIESYHDDNPDLPHDYYLIDQRANRALAQLISESEFKLQQQAFDFRRRISQYTLPPVFSGKSDNTTVRQHWPSLPLSNVRSSEGFEHYELLLDRQDYFEEKINNHKFVIIAKHSSGKLSSYLNSIQINSDKACETEALDSAINHKQQAESSHREISELMDKTADWVKIRYGGQYKPGLPFSKLNVWHRSHLGSEVGIESQQLILKSLQLGYSKDMELLMKLNTIADRVKKGTRINDKITSLVSQFNSSTQGLITALRLARKLYPQSSSIGQYGQDQLFLARTYAEEIKNSYQTFSETYLKGGQLEKEANRLRKIADVIQEVRNRISDIGLVIQQVDRFYEALLDASKQVQKAIQRANECVRQLQVKANQALTLANKKVVTQKKTITTKKSVAEKKPANTNTKITSNSSKQGQVSSSTPKGDVSGGIRIVGKDELFVGEEALYKVEDYGGKPFMDARWNTLRKNLRMFANGSVLALEPGEAMIMVRSEGMTAFKTILIKNNQETASNLGDLAGQSDQSETIDEATTKVVDSSTGGFSSEGGQTEIVDRKERIISNQITGPIDIGDGGFTSEGGETEPFTEPVKIITKSDENKQAKGFQPQGGKMEFLGVSPADSDGQGQIVIQADTIDALNNSRSPANVSGDSGRGDIEDSASLSPDPLRSDPVRLFGAGGQPAAYHIFAACSRLGWAAGLSRYTVGNADQDIVEHLMTAGEHMMWANRTSYPPTPAWPDWQSIRSKYQKLANGLINNRTTIYRNQLANRLRNSYEPLAAQLDLQTVKEVYQTTSCDGQYCRIGYQLAYGQQTLAIAEEAQANGNLPLAREVMPDGINHVAAARKSIENLKKVHPASGRCANLEGVRQELFQATKADSPDDSRYFTQQQWQETLRIIQALGSPVSAGDGLAGTWYNEQSGQKIIFEEKDGQFIGLIEGVQSSSFRFVARNRYEGRTLVSSHSGSASRSEWKEGASIEIDGDTANFTLGQFELKFVRQLKNDHKNFEKSFTDLNSLEGYWKFVWPSEVKDTWERGRTLYMFPSSSVISISKKGDVYQIKSCKSALKLAWGDFRKQRESYIGKVSSFLYLDTNPTKARVEEVEQCLSSLDCSPKNIDTAGYIQMILTPQDPKISVEVTGVVYPYKNMKTRGYLIRSDYNGSCSGFSYDECLEKYCGQECVTYNSMKDVLRGFPNQKCEQCEVSNRDAIRQCVE